MRKSGNDSTDNPESEADPASLAFWAFDWKHTTIYPARRTPATRLLGEVEITSDILISLIERSSHPQITNADGYRLPLQLECP